MNKEKEKCLSAYLEGAKLAIFNETSLDFEFFSIKVVCQSVITLFELRSR